MSYQINIIFLFLLAISCSRNLNQSKIKGEILAVLSEQEEAWSEGNLEAFMEGYWKSDSLTFIGKYGVSYGWKKTLANYKKRYPTKEEMGILKFNLIELNVLTKQDVQSIGKYTLCREKDTLKGYFSLLWKKINKNWVITSDHTSG